METLWVDFQNAGQDGVRLTCKGTIDEIAKKGLTLYEGLQLIIWTEDQDDDGNQDNLMVNAVIKYSATDDRWVAKFKMDDLKNESQIK